MPLTGIASPLYDFLLRRRPWGGTYRWVRAPSRVVEIGGGNALRRWDALEFAFLTYRVSPGDYTSVAHAVAVPHWFLALGSAILPAARGVKRMRRAFQRRRQRRAGHCVRCGYDLIPFPKPVTAMIPDEPRQPRQPTPRP